MAAVFSAPIVTSEVPVLSGDVLRSIKTPAVSPPSSTAAIPPSSTTSATVDATSIMNALAARRLSAGAILAEQVGIDLNAIGRSTPSSSFVPSIGCFTDFFAQVKLARSCPSSTRSWVSGRRLVHSQQRRRLPPRNILRLRMPTFLTPTS